MEGRRQEGIKGPGGMDGMDGREREGEIKQKTHSSVVNSSESFK